MRSRLALLAFVSTALLLGSSGCMTMLAPPRQLVVIDADAPNATIFVGGKTFGTPARLVLDTREDWEIDVSAPGYISQHALVESHASGGKIVGSVLLNAVAWGWWTMGVGLVVGVAVDVGSGSLQTLDPPHVHVAMQPVPGGPRDYSHPQPPPATASPPTAAPPPPSAAGPPPAAATAPPPAPPPTAPTPMGPGDPGYDPWRRPGTAQATFCRNCGRKLGGDEIYCPSCGQRIR